MTHRIVLPIALALLTMPAFAQEDLVIDQTRLYVSDPAACAALEDQGIDAFTEMDFLTFSFQDGIQSMEFHCNVYDIKGRPNTPVLFADAVCELPGELYPDIFAIAPNDAETIRVVSNADTTIGFLGGGQPDPENPYPAGTTLYHRCDNLSEIPID